MNDCIFCQIVAQQIPTPLVYEDDHCVVFNDLYPKAPVHQLLIPKLHIASLADLNESHRELMGHLTLLIPQIALNAGLTQGFKTLVNTGKGGGQEVFHLHYHILGTPA